MRTDRIILLPGENPEELERMQFHWEREWEPEGYMEERLVEILVYNDWTLARAGRRLQEAEASGTREDVERLTANRAQAERSFYRSLNALRQLRRDILREKLLNLKFKEELMIAKAKLERLGVKPDDAKPEACEKQLTPAQKLFAGQLYGGKKIAKKKIKILNQWVSVHAEEGKTVTTLYPPNNELIEQGQKMWPPPELVYRTFDFRCPVPKEYEWAVGHAKSTKQNGGVGIQRMTADEWLKCIEREKHDPHGHVGPTEVGNLPRPRERGGCDCPSCTNPENLQLLEEWEKSRAGS